MLSSCRTLFFIIVIFCAVFLGSQFNRIHISTELKDLSPSLSEDALIYNGIESISNNIESRFIVIVLGENRQDVASTQQNLINSFNEIDQVSTTSHIPEHIISQLKPYRFQLLTPQQHEHLQNNTITVLAEEASRSFYPNFTQFKLVTLHS